ncbi:Adaptive-response sensory-kinase SasA [Paenibacillus solanacearum]|uniref:histidine kinase n=1 Tax=Paenibacillus solanacearum TaxID=2048548 RepID=A0A916NNK5_9BACL|nr:HAMP domain-containing sensor histidine kinase [Paenibacillus solanacearum]CAG7613476.1 Adaptive-response sensory-kinase SasA [Paenibacillus solanacearum]
MSIRLRLTLWYTAILTATLLLLGLGLYIFLHTIYYSSLKDDLRAQTELLRSRTIATYTFSLEGGKPGYIFNIVGGVPRGNNVLFQVVNVDNGTKFPSSRLQEVGIQFPDIDTKKMKCILNESCLYEKARIDNMDFILYYTPIYATRFPAASELPAGIMQSAMYADDRLFVMLRLILTVTGLVAILLAASVGWFLARKVLKPIGQVIDATNRIEKGIDLDRRIEYNGPNDEIGVLTETINGMLGRLQHAYAELEEAYSAQRRFVSDASHELRTPLTTIRGNVELLEKMWKQAALKAGPDEGQKLELTLEAMHDISGEAERMSRLVNDLLSLARADAGFQMAKTNQPIRPIIDEVARKAALLPRSAEFQIGHLDSLNGVYVMGNADYLQQLLFIFIENAFKYTDAGFVRLDALRHEGQVGIRIEDTGIGMDKEEVPHIFDRFYRADPSRGQKAGTGLGLSIARWIIDEHHGSIEVKTLKDEGSTFVIWLPASSSGAIEVQGTEGHSIADQNQV